MRRIAGAAIAAVSLGSVLAAALAWFGLPQHAAATATAPVWTEIAWPFPTDPWGKGKAFRCKTADCGAEVNIYLRAKIGFCNCTTGVADDEDLDRMGDLALVGEVSPLGAGRPISIARMDGRSRTYVLNARNPLGKTAISVVFRERCDNRSDRCARPRPAGCYRAQRDRVSQWQHRHALGRDHAWPLI